MRIVHHINILAANNSMRTELEKIPEKRKDFINFIVIIIHSNKKFRGHQIRIRLNQFYPLFLKYLFLFLTPNSRIILILIPFSKIM